MRSTRFGGPVVPLVSIRDGDRRAAPWPSASAGAALAGRRRRRADRDRRWRLGRSARRAGRSASRSVGLAGETREVERGEVVTGRARRPAGVDGDDASAGAQHAEQQPDVRRAGCAAGCRPRRPGGDQRRRPRRPSSPSSPHVRQRPRTPAPAAAGSRARTSAMRPARPEAGRASHHRNLGSGPGGRPARRPRPCRSGCRAGCR